jgi:hypothetical protein
MDYIFRYATSFETSSIKFEPNFLIIGHQAITLKHWRNWEGETLTPRPKNWKESFEQPINWLTENDQSDKYLICIWCPENDWRYILQFGEKQGQDPFIKSSKMSKLPFIYSENRRISGLKTEWSKRLTEPQENMLCRLIGDPSDSLNIAIYHMRKSKNVQAS